MNNLPITVEPGFRNLGVRALPCILHALCKQLRMLHAQERNSGNFGTLTTRDNFLTQLEKQSSKNWNIRKNWKQANEWGPWTY